MNSNVFSLSNFVISIFGNLRGLIFFSSKSFFEQSWTVLLITSPKISFSYFFLTKFKGAFPGLNPGKVFVIAISFIFSSICDSTNLPNTLTLNSLKILKIFSTLFGYK